VAEVALVEKRRFIRAAKTAEKTPLLRKGKRDKRTDAAIAALRRAVFFETLWRDHGDEDDGTLVSAVESQQRLAGRWLDAEKRLLTAHKQGALAPGRLRDAVERACEVELD
jgi:hypothetical protein